MMPFSDQYPKSRIFKFVDAVPFDEALRRLVAFSLPSAEVEAFITGVSTAFPSVQQRLISGLDPKVFDRLTPEDIKVCIAFASRENLQKRCRLPLYGIVNDLLIAPLNRSPAAVAAVGPYIRLLIIALKKLEQEEVEASFAVPVESNPAAAAYVDEAIRSHGRMFSVRASVNFWGLATWTTMESLGDLLHFDRPTANHLVFQCRHFKGVDLAKFEELPRVDSLYAKANIIGHKEMLVAVPPAMFSVVSHNAYAGTPNKLVVQLKIESSSLFDYLGEADAATTIASLEQKKKENETKEYVARAFASVGATTANTKNRSLNLADVPQWMMEKLSGLPDDAKGILLKEHIDDEQVFLSLGEADLEKIGFSLGHRKKLLQISDEIKKENAAIAEAARRRIEQEQLAAAVATQKLQQGDNGAVVIVEHNNNNNLPLNDHAQNQQLRIESSPSLMNPNNHNNEASPPARSPFPSLLKPSIVGSDGTNINDDTKNRNKNNHNNNAQVPVPNFLQSQQQQQPLGGGAAVVVPQFLQNNNNQQQQQQQPHGGVNASSTTPNSAYNDVSSQSSQRKGPASEFGAATSTAGGGSVFSVAHGQGKSETEAKPDCYTIPTQDWLDEGNLPPNHPPHARVLRDVPQVVAPPPPQAPAPIINTNTTIAAAAPIPMFLQQQNQPMPVVPLFNSNNMNYNNMNQQNQVQPQHFMQQQQQAPPPPVVPQFFQQQQQQPPVPLFLSQQQNSGFFHQPAPVQQNVSGFYQAPPVDPAIVAIAAPAPQFLQQQQPPSQTNYFQQQQQPQQKVIVPNIHPASNHVMVPQASFQQQQQQQQQAPPVPSWMSSNSNNNNSSTTNEPNNYPPSSSIAGPMTRVPSNQQPISFLGGQQSQYGSEVVVNTNNSMPSSNSNNIFYQLQHQQQQAPPVVNAPNVLIGSGVIFGNGHTVLIGNNLVGNNNNNNNFGGAAPLQQQPQRQQQTLSAQHTFMVQNHHHQHQNQMPNNNNNNNNTNPGFYAPPPNIQQFAPAREW